MGKKLVWNEALDAYDRDLDLLEVTRNEYIQFLQQTLADTAARVKALSGGAFELRIWAEKEMNSPVEPVAEWKPQGLYELGGLVVQVYPGVSEGMPGSCCVCLWLDASATLPCELNALELRGPLLDASASLPGEAYDPAKHPSSDADIVHLRVITVELGAKDLVDQLATNVVTYCEAAQRLTKQIALVLHSADPYRWARARLLEVRVTREDELTAKGKWEWDPKARKLETWEDGRYLGVRKWKNGETDDLWVTAMPDGDVVFTAYGPTTGDKARWKALCALASGGARDFHDGKGATLLDAKAVKTMAAAGSTREFCDRVVAVFQAFLTG